MEKQNNENTAYANFINDLNEILLKFNINELNCS
jgi:hypothetical protein